MKNEKQSGLKSEYAKTEIGKIIAEIEGRIKMHESNYWELTEKALNDYKNDVEILRKCKSDN